MQRVNLSVARAFGRLAYFDWPAEDHGDRRPARHGWQPGTEAPIRENERDFERAGDPFASSAEQVAQGASGHEEPAGHKRDAVRLGQLRQSLALPNDDGGRGVGTRRVREDARDAVNGHSGRVPDAGCN